MAGRDGRWAGLAERLVDERMEGEVGGACGALLQCNGRMCGGRGLGVVAGLC